MISEQDFAAIIAMLAALYPRFKLEAETVRAYHAILSDLPIELLKAAALQIGSEPGTWFPSAGDIRRVAFDLMEREEGILTAGEAWAEARRVTSEHYYPGIKAPQPGHYSDSLVMETLKAVGGPAVFFLPLTTEHTTRARFMDTYKALLKRRQLMTRALPGVRETARQLSASRPRELGAGGEVPALAREKTNDSD